MPQSINPQAALDSPQYRELLSTAPIGQAFLFIDQSQQEVTDELIRICEIPAPPFKEEARAAYIKHRFEEIGLERVRSDAEGNIIAERSGRSSGPSVVVSAHLDTVFPEGTDVRVRREGRRLCAPGISDNTCGLVSLISIARALDSGRIETEGPIYFVATVGEEGEGNLRGVRYLFAEGDFSRGVDAFISLDGPGLERITQRALGSRRYRVTITGQGGHSWGDFGIVNPVHALGRAIARFAAYPAPVSPRTSYNVGVIEGGSSVNAIPETGSMTVDMRSVSSDEIDKLETYLQRVVDLAVREENSQRAMSGTSLTFHIEQIGNRPSGETPLESPLVRAAIECSRALGIEPRLDCSSTDSNIPISLGIPAITIGTGGRTGGFHALSEWIDVTDAWQGAQNALVTVLGLVGVQGVSEPLLARRPPRAR